jgi:hypothetical protein
LKEVPLVDPAAFTLPAEPFDKLWKLHSFDQLPRYEERFRANQDATLLIKHHLRSRSGPLKTDRITVEDNRVLLLLAYMLFFHRLRELQTYP